MTPRSFEHPAGTLRIWTDAPRWEGAPTAAISNLVCADAEAGAEVLRACADDLGQGGITRIIGPMEGDTWHSYRVVTESDGSRPFLMEPSSPAHHRIAFELAGFAPIAGYFSARAPIAAALGPAPDADPSILVEAWDGSDPQSHFREVHALSLSAFATNAFYKPIDAETFLGMYMPFVPMLVPELVLLARDARNGALVGYLFGLPNYAAGRDTGEVILKTYASLRPGVGHHLSHAFHSAAARLGFTDVIHALIHEDNRSAERSRRHGAQVFRRYALMGLRLVP